MLKLLQMVKMSMWDVHVKYLLWRHFAIWISVSTAFVNCHHTSSSWRCLKSWSFQTVLYWSHCLVNWLCCRISEVCSFVSLIRTQVSRINDTIQAESHSFTEL